MPILSAQATLSLTATASPTRGKTSGTIQIGTYNSQVSFQGADIAYSCNGVMAATANAFAIAIASNGTSGSTAFAAGARQVETATAAGTISTAGNALLTVTAAGMTGSPKVISFAVGLSDTAAAWATKARAALAADADVAALFDVSGATTAIILTRKTVLGIALANDATLNLAIANDTSAGITAAPTSANTTAGVASTGTLVSDGSGIDFEGKNLLPIVTLFSVLIQCEAGSCSYTTGSESGAMAAGESRLFVGGTSLASLLGSLVFTATAPRTSVSLVVTGKST